MPGAEKAVEVRKLNDRFRSSFDQQLGRVVMTIGVDALPSDVKAMAIPRVATFSDFNANNDPHGEHDFGSFTLSGYRLFFKIDLYEEPGVKGADGQPLTTRVLTIMLAEEW